MWMCETREDGMGGIYGMYTREEKYIQYFGVEPKRDRLEGLGVDRREVFILS